MAFYFCTQCNIQLPRSSELSSHIRNQYYGQYSIYLLKCAHCDLEVGQASSDKDISVATMFMRLYIMQANHPSVRRYSITRYQEMMRRSRVPSKYFCDFYML